MRVSLEFPRMNRQTKREIRWLAHESWMGRLTPSDPREFERAGESRLRFVAARLTSTGDVGTLLMLGAPILPLVPVIWIASHSWGRRWLDVSVIAAITLLVAFFVWRSVVARRERRQLISVNHSACLWCRHPLTEEIRRGLCPECGLAYDADTNRRLIEMTLNPARPESRIYLTRAARLWARAVIWRERGRFVGATEVDGDVSRESAMGDRS